MLKTEVNMKLNIVMCKNLSLFVFLWSNGCSTCSWWTSRLFLKPRQQSCRGTCITADAAPKHLTIWDSIYPTPEGNWTPSIRKATNIKNDNNHFFNQTGISEPFSTCFTGTLLQHWRKKKKNRTYFIISLQEINHCTPFLHAVLTHSFEYTCTHTRTHRECS